MNSTFQIGTRLFYLPSDPHKVVYVVRLCHIPVSRSPVSRWHWNHTSQRERPTGYTLPAWHLWYSWQPWIGKRPFLHQFLGHDMANGPSRLPLCLIVRVGWEAWWRRASRRGRKGLGRGPGRQQRGRLPVDSCAAYKWNNDPLQVDSAAEYEYEYALMIVTWEDQNVDWTGP